jgi:hypothetical protein
MSDLTKLQNYIDEKKQWRNKASRHLAKILYDILEHNEPAEKEKDITEEKNEYDDLEDDEEEEEMATESLNGCSKEPDNEPEPEPEPEVFKMDDVSVGTVNEVEEESDMMDTMSLLEVSVAGDMESHDGLCPSGIATTLALESASGTSAALPYISIAVLREMFLGTVSPSAFIFPSIVSFRSAFLSMSGGSSTFSPLIF